MQYSWQRTTIVCTLRPHGQTRRIRLLDVLHQPEASGDLELRTHFDARNAMNYDYPLEQLARSARTRFQLGFARLTMKLLPRFDEVAFEPSTQGLRIFAETEMALALPGEVIRQMHPDEVEISNPIVRVLGGDESREPIMWVRVSVKHADAEPVLQDLLARQARIEEVDWGLPRTVIRARAPLRRLLGYPQALPGLSDSSADLRMWLTLPTAVPSPIPGVPPRPVAR